MYMRKKQIMAGLLALFIFLTFRGVFADGTCGTNVKYTVDGNTISFAKGDGTEDPKWEDVDGSNCGAVFRDNAEITSVKVTEKISVTNGNTLFSDFRYVREMDLSKLDVSAVTDMSYMFLDCGSLESLDLSGWDTSSVTDMKDMFRECGSLESLDLSGWDTSSVTDMSGMFLGCGSLSSVDVSGWDTSGVEGMADMFDGCSYLESLDVSGWDTSSVTSMSGMFQKCGSLSSVDVSGWNTSGVKGMAYMFNDCESLESLDVSGWDTSKVTDMSYMFRYCGSLSSLDVSGWDTSSVTDMHYMFDHCSSLTSLDISGWNTSVVTDMSYMFQYCYSLSSLDLSGWDTSAVTSMIGMFDGCSSLQTLALGKNTVGINIFRSLPGSIYDSTWYYLKTGAAAGNPLDAGAQRSGDGLFSDLQYDHRTMAGVWSTDPDLVLAKSIRIEYPAGTDVTGQTIALDSTEVQLAASASPEGAGQKFFWHSSNPKTAVVDADGKVTFKKAGKVTITVKAADCSGVYAETALTYGLAESVMILGPDGKDITGGAETIDTTEYQLKAKALPEGVQQEFTWKSSDTDTASVSSDGKVTFKKAGTVSITAEAADGSEKSAEATLTLKAEEDPAEITTEAEVIRGGNAIDLDDCVRSAVGDVSFSINGEDLGCGLDPDSHVLTSGEKTGKVTVAVTVADSDFHYGKTGTVTISVIEKKQETLEVEQKGAVFGETLPAPEYSAPEGTVSETVLYSGAGYGPSEELPSEPGSYTITVSCETKDTVYTGTAEFTIAPKPLSDPSVTAKLLPADSFTWTGETFEITGAEVRDGDKLLTEGSDYELGGVLKASDPGTYEAVISAGADTGTAASAAAKAVSGSRYAGSITLTWRITPAETPEPTPEPCPICCPGCHLPATGFSSGRPADPGAQPKDLRYRPAQMRLQIPSLDLETELVTVPLKDSIWQVDWLNDMAGILDGTALPGEGVSVIAAHNTLSGTDYGPFALLYTLNVNDTVMVRDEKGSLKLFRVYASELLAPDDTERLASIASREKNTLVLVTCENESAEGGYLNRRAVFAAQK